MELRSRLDPACLIGLNLHNRTIDVSLNRTRGGTRGEQIGQYIQEKY